MNGVIGPILKLDLYFFVLAGLVNGTRDSTKKHKRQHKRKCIAIQTNTKYYKILGKIKIQKQQKEQVRNIFSDGFKLPLGGRLNCWGVFFLK